MILEATPDGAEQAAEALQRALCPDPDHPGPCTVPWTLMTCRFEDIDDGERHEWERDFGQHDPDR